MILTIARVLRRGLILMALAVTLLAPTAVSAQSIDPATSFAFADPGFAIDAAYIVQTDRGTVVFGDGGTGRAPSAGSSLAASYAYGGGAAGNVDPSAWLFDIDGVFCLVFGC